MCLMVESLPFRFWDFVPTSEPDDGSCLVHDKAANGEGSIHPRSDGRWTATFRDAFGRTRTVSARTRALVLAKRAAALEDVRFQAPTRFDRSTGRRPAS